MRASVILVSYNSRTDLVKCLPTLVPSLASSDELIVVDNASSDGTATWLVDTYPQIHLICNDKNIGFAGGNNLGARQASGKYLAFLNPDTTVDPAWLNELIDALESYSSAGLATSKILLMDQPGLVNTCGNDVHISGITLCHGIGQPSNIFDLLERVNSVSGAAFVIRRELFDLLGGFDEAMFMYIEDTDLSLRARLAGYCSILVPSSIVYHRYSLRFGPRKVYFQERNRYRMLMKLLDIRSLFRLFPVFFLAELITWGFVLLRQPHRFYNKIFAYAYVLTHLRGLYFSRHAVQSTRRVSDRILLTEWHNSLDFDQTGSSFSTRLAAKIFDPLFTLLNHQAADSAHLRTQKEYVR